MVPLGTPDQPRHGTPLVLPLPIHQAPLAMLPETHPSDPEPNALSLDSLELQALALGPGQAVVLEPGPADSDSAVPPVTPQEILLENLYLRRRVQDLEAMVAIHDHKHCSLPERHQAVYLESPQAVQLPEPTPSQAALPEPGQVVPPLAPQELLLETLQLRRRIQDLEAIVKLRDLELEKREAELVCYRVGGLGSSLEVSNPSPPPTVLFVRPQPTIAELLTSSIWARSGCADPSVEVHPLSSWYLWFRSMPPFPTNDNEDFLILEPAEPALSPDEQRPIPYSIPQYVFPLLGAEARRVDEELAKEAALLVKTGQKIKPPSPTFHSRRASLGRWEGAEIVTVLQAHNLRHHAITDHNRHAIRTYKQLHTRFTDRTRPRSEGIEYLMKAFSGDVRYFS